MADDIWSTDPILPDASGDAVPSFESRALQPGDTSSSAARNRSLARTDSPCVAVCSTLYDDVCRGCGRTTMEVANWVFLSDEEKQEIWVRIKAQGYPRRQG
jgi:predicted Fe-S protein YdhL (DUF1289 family)